MKHKARGPLTAGRGIALGLLAWLASAAFAVAAPAAGQAGAAPAAGRAGADIAAQLAAAHLAEPLVATGPTTPAEDGALARAVAAYQRRADPDDFSSLTGFLSAYPKSGWRPAVLTDLGIDYLHYGYFSRALDAWQTAWREGKDATGFRAKALVDRAVGELVQLDAAFGYRDKLAALLTEIGDRPVSGPATELVQRGRDTLWIMQTDPKHLYLCGPTALKMLMLAQRATLDQVKFLSKVRAASPKGTSLAEVAELAKQAKVPLDLVFRKPGETVPVPSIVHWKVNHFAAIVAEANGRYRLQDPTFGHQGVWVTRAALDAEASGYFLAPAKEAQAADWRKVGPDEAARVWGAGLAGNCGMCGYGINEEAVGLSISDTPVGYKPPLGPSAQVTLLYDQRDLSQPANFNFFNVGQKWTFNWLSFVEDDPAAAGANVGRYDRNNGFLYSEAGFDSSTRSFAPEEDDASVLVLEKSSPITYERFLSDGSVETYAQSDGSAVSPRRVFLTRVTDPQGNSVTLGYGKTSGQMRLVSLKDATGRKTTFSYGKSGFPLLISKIADPFGRSAALAYDGQGRLISITDTIGLTSKLTYDASSLINSLTTPYGTTRFAYGTSGGPGGLTDRRFLNITDPLGFGEREESFEPATMVPFSDAHVPQLPPGTLLNQYLIYRNSFHWNKHQYAAAGCTPNGGCQYRDARITHFVHDAENTGMRWSAVESIKEPLESRVWYTYPGQPVSGGLEAAQSGTYDQPTAVARVLDNGQTQLKQFAYNAAGNRTEQTDPVGRQTLFSYAPNLTDIIAIAQATGGGSATIAKFTYNSQRRPLTYTDSAGKVTHYTYNAAGQLASETDPLGEKTSYFYNPLGYLTKVVNANGKTAASYTYDSASRVASYTDSEGWTVKYAYDAADRLTTATYLDGTTEDYTYNKLDLASMTDRQGRVWSYAHDADRRLTSVTDPLGHKTSYAYFEDGTLKSLTDPDGHVTRWDIDVESRPTAKHYADGSTTLYAYELSTSRLKSLTDALGQTKSYQYALDDRLAGIRYQNALNPTPNVGFAYDAFFPRLVTMTDGTGTTRYSYVAPGSLGALRLLREAGPLPNGAVTYGYDALGRVVSRTVGGASAETFQYDPIGRLAGHTDALGKFTLGYLGETGQLASRGPSATGITTRWSYLGNGGDRRLAGIANAAARQYQYTTTPEDLITRIRESKGASLLQSWSLGYDNDNRLLGANSTSGAKFGYTLDPAGNITRISQPSGAATLAYNKTNTLTAAGAQAVTADADGDIVSDGARTYSWDAENRLVAITYKAQPGKTTTFTYDGLDRRVAIKTTLSGKTTVADYIWCGLKLCQSRNGASTVSRLYYDEGEVIPAPVAANDTRFFYGPDQIGSVRDVFATSPTAGFSMVQAYDYDPYGNATKMPASGPFTDFRYAGMLLHADSGLYLTQYRAYDPRTGRWLSRDPLGEFPAGLAAAYAAAASSIGLRYTPEQPASARGNLLSQIPTLLSMGSAGEPYGGIMHASSSNPLTDFRDAGTVAVTRGGYYPARYRASEPRVATRPSLGPIDETGSQALYAYVDGNPVSATDLRGLDGSGASCPANPPPDPCALSLGDSLQVIGLKFQCWFLQKLGGGK